MQYVGPKWCPSCKRKHDRCVIKCECGQIMLEFLGGFSAFYIGELDLATVLPLFNTNKNFQQVVYNEVKWRVRLDYVKKSTFTKDGACVGCGAKITKCLLFGRNTTKLHHKERHAARLMWCSDDYKVFTIDHIIARGRGGPDCPENYQTMCWTCNVQKSVDDNPQGDLSCNS